MSSRKATGIVRRIDDLGRVVIPKEIRRTLRIREGEPLEIFVDRSGEVILKKYSPILDLASFSDEFTESLRQTTGHIAIVCDRDQVISVAGHKEFRNKEVGKVIEKCFDTRTTIIEGKGGNHELCLNMDDYISSYAVTPIITGSGDVIGAVALISLEEGVRLGVVESKLAEVGATFLSKLMEE